MEDTGHGISTENQNKLFKLFGFVEETESLNTNGIGLGLMICDQIVKQYNGEIKLESELEKGSKFILVLKLLKPETVAAISTVKSFAPINI